MQPAWRKNSDASGLPVAIDKAKPKQDVSTLKKCGPNGIVTVIIGLKWWAANRDHDERWVKAVLDVIACLESFLSQRNKRKGTDENANDGRSAKKSKV